MKHSFYYLVRIPLALARFLQFLLFILMEFKFPRYSTLRSLKSSMTGAFLCPLPLGLFISGFNKMPKAMKKKIGLRRPNEALRSKGPIIVWFI